MAEVGEPAAEDPVQLLGADDLTRRPERARVQQEGVLLRSAEPAVRADVRLERRGLVGGGVVAAVDDDVRAVRERRSAGDQRSEEHTSELQSRQYLVCRLLLE